MPHFKRLLLRAGAVVLGWTLALSLASAASEAQDRGGNDVPPPNEAAQILSLENSPGAVWFVSGEYRQWMQSQCLDVMGVTGTPVAFSRLAALTPSADFLTCREIEAALDGGQPPAFDLVTPGPNNPYAWVLTSTTRQWLPADCKDELVALGARIDVVSFHTFEDRPLVPTTFSCADVPSLLADGANFSSCDQVVTVSLEECESLVSLHGQTNGAEWANNGNWLRHSDPCTWFGVACDDGAVKGLDLSGNGLVALPAAVAGLPNLQSLKLANNSIATLPEALGAMTTLQTLDLAGNDLSDIPPQVYALANLKRLDLSKNQMTGSLPVQLANFEHLQVLILATNSFRGNVPAELGQLIHLKVLDLSGNEFSGAVPAELGNLSFLQELLLNNNQLAALSPGLSELAVLKTLDVSYNQLRGDVAAAVAGITDTAGVINLADAEGGNDCLTVSDSTLADLLTVLSPGWDRCDASL